MEIPPRTVTDAYLARRGVQLDIAFDVDLGELTRGHHIVARGIMFGRLVRVPKHDPARLRALMDAADDPNNGGGFIRRPRNAESAAWEERRFPEFPWDFHSLEERSPRLPFFCTWQKCREHRRPGEC